MHAISTLQELSKLNTDDIVQGYRHGFAGVTDHTRTDQSYWHGWFNALSDKNPEFISDEQRRLAQEFHQKQLSH